MAKTTKKTGKGKKAKPAANMPSISLDHPRALIKHAYGEAKKMRYRGETFSMAHAAEDGWMAVNLIADLAAVAVGRRPGGRMGAREAALGELEHAAGLRPDSLTTPYWLAHRTLFRFLGRGCDGAPEEAEGLFCVLHDARAFERKCRRALERLQRGR